MPKTQAEGDIDLIAVLTLNHVRAVREAFWVGTMIGMCGLLVLLCCGQWLINVRHIMRFFVAGRAG